MPISPPDLGTSFTLDRTFNASAERVFRAWTEAEALEAWFQPMGNRIIVRQLDVRLGGSYHFDLAVSPTETHTIVGQYIEIQRPEKLVFTWASPATNNEDTIVTVLFAEANGKTQVTLTQEKLMSEEILTAHKIGWESVIDRIADVIAQES